MGVLIGFMVNIFCGDVKFVWIMDSKIMVYFYVWLLCFLVFELFKYNI